MKFEKLNNNKIRIVLSSKDITLNNICINDVFNENCMSSQFIQDIIYEAEQKMDFNIENDKILVEILKSTEGGLIFNITKFEDCDEYIYLNLMFEFKSFEDFLCLCTYLKNMNFFDFEKSSSKFSLALYNNTYYLSIKDYCDLPSPLINILNEFGKFIYSSSKLDGLINEYGKIIFKQNAICEGFKMIKKALP